MLEDKREEGGSRLVRTRRDGRVLALFFSVALHLAVLAFLGNHEFRTIAKAEAPRPQAVIFLQVSPTPAETKPPAPTVQFVRAAPGALEGRAIRVSPEAAPTSPPTTREAGFMEAPPAPTAQEWAFAAKYKLKNSKGYRYTWGQQVRSMMGTAVEGPDQGVVRFRVEIAPDGTLARLDTLWTTSDVAERLARKAVENMPQLPPTPSGEPLIFERTISFQPFASDVPPIYANDCLPDPPAWRNPFAWDGKSPQVRVEPEPVKEPDPEELEECLKQLPQDSIEAESANDQRQVERWGSNKLAR